MSLLCLKGIVLLLVLLLCNVSHVSEARQWGHINHSFSTKKSAKGKDHHHSNHHHGGGSSSKPRQKPKHKPKRTPSPEPSPNPTPHPKPKHKPKPTPSPEPSHTPVPSPSPEPTPTPSPTPTSPAPSVATFNVVDYGAKGDGVTDDTKAFVDAWSAACKVKASTVVVPSKYEFLVGPLSFAGPNCQTNMVFQLDGKIVAVTGSKAWRSNLLQWLEFTKLNGITIQGSGVIDGQGSSWWSSSKTVDDTMSTELAARKMSDTRPTALRFYGSRNVTVTGVTIRNSPKAHLKFDDCEDVQVFNFAVSSPGDSPNTDGIHLQNSIAVHIHHSRLACGDDCISIQTGCSDINIHDVKCGPGHGISIGGLGKDHTVACVSNVTVRNAAFTGSTNGVRIKTWQGGLGSVKKVSFSNIQVSQVPMPIVIDQYYCDSRKCKNQTSAVALSDISYENIQGTYTVEPVHLACSDSKPCSGINLRSIKLEPMQLQHSRIYGPFCWNAFGELHDPIQPPINCLKTGYNTTGSRMLRDQNLC